MAVWTVFVCAVQPELPVFGRGERWRPSARALVMAVADLAVAITAVLLTEMVDTHARVATGSPTLPGTWAAGAVLGAAVVGGARVGFAAAILLSAALVIERKALAATTTSSITLLILAGLVVGYLATTALNAEREVARIRAFEAARAERDRLARAIHDGALQALALIARESPTMDRAAIADLAAQQEVALRSHISALVLNADVDPSGDVDVRRLLSDLDTVWPHRQVSLAMPAEPVVLPHHDAVELTAAIRAALENVDRHAGAAARAWVLVEDETSGVVVTVRDDGVGMAPDRATQARAAGRLGLATSVIGRVRSLGGDATITSSPGAGVEVELRVPRR
jgi:signal transduction histidine kinase